MCLTDDIHSMLITTLATQDIKVGCPFVSLPALQGSPLKPKTWASDRTLVRGVPAPPTLTDWPVVVVSFRPSMHLGWRGGRWKCGVWGNGRDVQSDETSGSQTRGRQDSTQRKTCGQVSAMAVGSVKRAAEAWNKPFT